MDKYVAGIYPTEGQLKPLRSRPIAIILTEGIDKMSITTASAQLKEERHDRNNIRENEIKLTINLNVAKQISSKPKTMQKMLVVGEGKEPRHLERDKQLARRE